MLLQKAVTAAKDYTVKLQIGLFISCLHPTNNNEISM